MADNINRSSLRNLDQSKADNLLTNLGENINSASNKLITGDFSNATSDLEQLQSDYEVLMESIKNNNLYEVLGEKISQITSKLKELKNSTDSYLQSQQQSLNDMLSALPQVSSCFMDIEKRIIQINEQLSDLSGMQSFSNQINILKNKLNEIIALPLDDKTKVQECANSMAKIYVETVQSALQTANIGKGLIVEAIKSDKYAIADEIKRIVEDTTMAINIMPNIVPSQTNNLNGVTNDVVNTTRSSIEKFDSSINKMSGIIDKMGEIARDNNSFNKENQNQNQNQNYNNENIQRIYDLFKNLKPIDYENVRHTSNEAQTALTNELINMISGGSTKDADAINNLIDNYKKISESSTLNMNAQETIKSLAQDFIDKYETGKPTEDLASIWNETKVELSKLVIESNKIAHLIEQNNNQRNSLDPNLHNIENLYNGLGYYNSRILHDISGGNEIPLNAEIGGIYSRRNAETDRIISEALNAFSGGGGGGNKPPRNFSLGVGGPEEEPDLSGRYWHDMINLKENRNNFLNYSEKLENRQGAGNYKDIDKKINDALEKALYIERGIRTGRYNDTDILRMEAKGYDKTYFEDLISQLGDLRDEFGERKSIKQNLNEEMKKYTEAYDEFNDDPTVEGLQDLDNRAKEINSLIEKLNAITSSIADKLNGEAFQDIINNKFNGIDGQVAKDSSSMGDTLFDLADKVNESSDNMQRASYAFGHEIESSMVRFGNTFDKISKTMTDTFESISSTFKDLKRSFSNIIGKLSRFTGINFNYLSQTIDYYKKFGAQDVSTTKATFQQGYGLDVGLNQFINEKTIADFANYNGIIKFGDYSNQLNALISGVQGHTGRGYDKVSGVQDMLDMADMATKMNNVYDVDTTSAINTFYKTLSMTADETTNYLYKLVQTAQNSNIPISQYVKLIEQLSTNFNKLGINIELANIGMNNLMLNGISYSDAQSFTTSYASALSNFGNNPAEAAFYGAMTGQNPWDATWDSVDLWSFDENGNYVVDNTATDRLMMMFDAKTALYDQIGGGTKFGNTILHRMFKDDMGFSSKDAAMAVELYRMGDSQGLAQLFNSAGLEDENTVKLEGQAELEAALNSMATQVDELTAAENQVKVTSMELAEVNQTTIDKFGEFLQSALAEIGSIMIDLTGALTDLVNAISGTGFGSGILNNPLKTTAIAAGGYTMLKGGINLATKGKFGGATGKLGGKVLKSSGSTISAATSAAKSTMTTGGTRWGAAMTAGKATAAGSKAVPIIGGVIDGVTTGIDSYYSQNKTVGYAAGEAIGSGVGSGLGGWGGAAAGAAIGTAIFPGIGTAIGTVIGGIGGAWGGGKLGKKATQVGMDAFDVQEYRDGYGPNSTTKDRITSDSTNRLNSSYTNTNYYGPVYQNNGASYPLDQYGVQRDYRRETAYYDSIDNMNDSLDKQVEEIKRTNDITSSNNERIVLSNEAYMGTLINNADGEIELLKLSNEIQNKMLTTLNLIYLKIANLSNFNSGNFNGSTVHTSESGAIHGGASGSWNVTTSTSSLATDGVIASNTNKLNAKIKETTQSKTTSPTSNVSSSILYNSSGLTNAKPVTYDDYSISSIVPTIESTTLDTSGVTNTTGYVDPYSEQYIDPTTMYSDQYVDPQYAGSEYTSLLSMPDRAIADKAIHNGSTITLYEDGSRHGGASGSWGENTSISTKNEHILQYDKDRFTSYSELPSYNTLGNYSKPLTPLAMREQKQKDRWTTDDGSVKPSSGVTSSILYSGSDATYDGSWAKEQQSTSSSSSVTAEALANNMTTNSFNNYNSKSLAPIYKLGSAEYSNQTTQYDPSAFENGYDPLDIKITSAQGFARKLATNPEDFKNDINKLADEAAATAMQSASMEAIANKYSLELESTNNSSGSTRTGYNSKNTTNQQFEININVSGGADMAEEYSKAIEQAITEVTKEFYNNSDIVSESTYNIYNSDY